MFIYNCILNVIPLKEVLHRNACYQTLANVSTVFIDCLWILCSYLFIQSHGHLLYAFFTPYFTVNLFPRVYVLEDSE